MDSTNTSPNPGIAFGAKNANANANATAAIVPRPLKQNTLSDPKAVLCAFLHRRIPRTPNGQLAGVLRPDLLDAHATPQDYTHVSAFPEEAFLEFNFDEGFPALPSGAPIWFKLPYETPELFACFETYLEIIQEGPRHVAQLLSSAELEHHLGEDLNLDFLRNVYHMYYWKDRARAYDTFQEAAYRHIRTRRALATEDHAYLKSSAYLEKVEGILESPNFWKQLEMDPKVTLDFFKELLKIKRISAGMPAAAPMEEGGGGSSSFEMIMRKVQEETRSMVPNGGDGDGEGLTLDSSGRVINRPGAEFMRAVLESPDSAKSMQEVIIRMTQQNGATKQPRWAGKAIGLGDEEYKERLPDGLSNEDLPND